MHNERETPAMETMPLTTSRPGPDQLRPGALSAKLGLAGKAATIACHLAWESVRRPQPTSVDSIPRSPEALTCQWLTSALCADVPRAGVVGFKLVGGSDGSTSRRAIQVAYNTTGQGAGLPERLFSKSTPKFTSRLITGPASQALRTEAAFYNTIRPGLPIEAPQGYFAAVDERSYRSIFLIEDVCVTRGARFGSAVDLAVDRPMAESMVRQMATYHAALWQSPRFDQDLRWVQSAYPWHLDTERLIPFERRNLVGLDRAEAVLPPELLARKSEIYPALLRSLVLNAQAPETLLHSDVHLGNWYVTDTGQMGQHDWQCITKGQWALDVSYALSCALRIEDRRAWERDLIELYLQTLAKGGVDAPSFDAAFLAYRRQIFHGLVFWTFTIGRSPLHPKMQPDEISLANLERMGQAVVDLESIDACNAG